MPPPPEEYHEAIENVNPIIQGIQAQSYKLEGLAQSNALLTSSNSAVMEQLSQLTVTMNSMQAQLYIFSSAPTNQTRNKSNYYCWICGRNYTHGYKTCSANKAGHK